MHTTSSAHIATRSIPTVSSRPERLAISSLVPDAVRRRGEEAAVADLEQAGEPAHALDELGPRGAATQLADQLDGLRGRVEVDAGAPVRLRAHDFAGCSSRNLPACSGIGIGYSPSKHARQNESGSWPVAATIPSSDRYPSESAPT